MQTVAEARERVDRARSDSELQAALTDLASALYEADAEESVRVADQSIALGEGSVIRWPRRGRVTTAVGR